MEEFTEVYVWGSDSQGQLGQGSKTVCLIPRLCSFNILIKELSCGEEHSALVSQSGYVYTMGSNSDGRLGIGTRHITQSSSPCLVESLTSCKAVKISAGFAHTVVVTQNGEAFAWGLGENGALGTGSNESQWSPCLVKIKEKVLDVSCGARHTGFVVDRGLKNNLFMCGASESGQLGTGTREKETVPVSVVLEDQVIQISCGLFHSGAVTVNGKVFMTGGNSSGQLGIGNKKSKFFFEKVDFFDSVGIARIYCSTFTAALTERGGVYVWGSGNWGEYLVPSKISAGVQFKQVSIGSTFAVLLDICNAAYCFGENEESTTQPVQIPGLKGKKVSKVSCGSKFVIALGNDQTARPGRENRARLPNAKDIVNKSFEDLKTIHNKSLKNFRAERNKNLKLIENLETDVKKFKLDVKKIDKDRMNLEKENQELSQIIENLRLENLEVNQKLLIYQERLNMQKVKEEGKKNWKNELSKIEQQNFLAQRAMKDLINSEALNNAKLIEEIENLKNEKMKMENDMSFYVEENNDLKERIQKFQSKCEVEKRKFQVDMENCLSEIKNLKMRKLEIERSESEMYIEQIVEQKRALEYMQEEIEMLKKDINSKSNEFLNERVRMQKELDFALSSNSEKGVEIQVVLNENSELRDQIEKAERENEKLTEKLKRNSSEKNELESKLLETQQRLFELDIAKSNFIKISETSKEDQDTLLKSNKELSSQISELKTITEKLQNENNNLKDKLRYELENLKNKHKVSETEQKALVDKLSSEISQKLKENSELALEVQKKNKDLNDLEQKSLKINNENNLMKQTIDSLKLELDEGKENKGSLAIRCEKLQKENMELKNHISEIEGKNREVFSNLEKDLAQKAKIYKDRTMNLLSGPRSSTQICSGVGTGRSRSPFMNDEEGNAAASLLTALDKSPSQVKTTPTGASVKARINALLKDKSQIEAELSKCDC